MKLYLRYMKEYKKNTVTVFLCFLLTVVLISGLLILMHTNHRVEALQNMLTHTPADVRITSLNENQVEILRNDSDISKMAIFEKPEYVLCDENRIYFQCGDDLGITLTGRLEKGRMPENETEVVMEKWVLLNLGKEPDINQEITLENENTGVVQEFTIVGILSDVLRNKQVGLLTMYSCLEKEYNGPYISYINYKNNWNIEHQKEKTAAKLDIPVKNIQTSPGRENMEELLCIDIVVITAILLFFCIIFSGIYRIQLIARQEQYGVLRAIGIKKNIFKQNILLELGIIYVVAVPLGVGIGNGIARGVMKLSGDEKQIIYLYGERVRFGVIVPVIQIIIGLLLLAVAISCVGLVACHSIYKKSIIEVISNEVDPNVHRSSKFLRIDKSSSKLRTFWILSLKYVLRDFKTSIFMMLTICMGVSLFYGLFYKAQIAHDIHYETKEMYFFNGEYAMNVLTFQTADYGISRESIKEILSLDKVKEIETATGLPIRVVDNGDVEKNNEYFNASNAKKKEIYGYSDDVFDGEDQVYKSVLYGYNDNALAKLQKYVIDGKFIPEEIKENEVILCEMRESDDKTGIQKVGWYKDGEPLFQYKVGEQISIKYREDMKTGTQDYERFLDNVSDYTTKKYKIVAVVSFPYISDVKYSQYPIFITKDAYIEGLIGDSKIQSMYINGKENLSDEEKIQLENQLINIGTKNSQVSTRSLITERDKADMLYQKEIINIVGIALVFLILALTNIANNMKFRVQTRKRENSILRAIGLKYKAVEEIVILEIANICFVSFIGGYGASQIISRYLYSQSDLKNFGYVYKFDVVIYLLVCLSTLAVCAFISYWIVKKSSSKNIIEDMNYIE